MATLFLFELFLAGSLPLESVHFSVWNTELLMSICTLKMCGVIRQCLPYYIKKKAIIFT